MRKIRFYLTCSVIFWLLILSMQSLAGGRVEHHKIESQILKKAGYSHTTREVSVYLPEGYDSSGLAYPAFYLLQGAGYTNRDWFTFGFDQLFDDVPNPMIIVMPDEIAADSEYEHLLQEVLPFIDGRYRTIANRRGRAIGGICLGGSSALHIVFSHPELFCCVTSISTGGFPSREMVEAYLQQRRRYPLRFWFSYGRNEFPSIVEGNPKFIKMLKELGLPCEYAEDEGAHLDLPALRKRLMDSLTFASECLGGGVPSVKSHGKLATMWGKVKRGTQKRWVSKGAWR